MGNRDTSAMKIETPSPMFDTSEMVLNMGPQHPSTHGVLRIVLRLDGERVIDADVVAAARDLATDALGATPEHVAGIKGLI